jgi:hypothetical protein
MIQSNTYTEHRSEFSKPSVSEYAEKGIMEMGAHYASKRSFKE